VFTDVRDIPSGGTIEADVCVVGGGAAGIALATEFADRPARVVVLESGGLRPEESPNILEIIAGPPARLAVDSSRRSCFGGNTNHWAGNCRPLDQADFASRDWIPHSGWPISAEELLPYYERAQLTCGLSDLRWYDLDACRPHLEHLPLSVDPAVLESRVLHTCPTLRFAELHGDRLEASRNVQILLHARALSLKTNAGGDRVNAVEFVSKEGQRSRVEADVFVLAAGGIENPRLLLCSNDVSPNGVGNDHDLVGRFFMDHWYVELGLGGWDNGVDRRLYGGRQMVGGASIWAQLVLSEALMRKERVPGLSLWFERAAPDAPSVDSTRRIVKSLLGRRRPEQLITEARLLLTDPGEVPRHLLRKLSHRSEVPLEGYALWVQVEQTPDPANRIRLSSSRDRFGQPHAELVLRLTEAELRGHILSLRHAADELGLSSARLGRQMELMLRAGRHGFFWHHMGTTRMADDPTEGVIDRNCQVHGVSNLFVASSSAFPTGGTAAPTLTIVALALRLADHIRRTRGLPAREQPAEQPCVPTRAE
jgi:choline dehydrogenase-like flavoprotein